MPPREPEADLSCGTRVGPYEINGVLGRGAQGVVYRAIDRRDGSTVALKVRRTTGGRSTSSNAAELRALTRVRHDRVVELRGVAESDGLVALALEYLPGSSLSSVLGGGALDGATVEAIARDVLAGLDAVHAAGVVHRDVKPSNLLLDAHGRPKLSDFGIAREEREGEGTGVRQIEGSPPYMAPEVILGDEATTRSDLFSLGVILHRALHGRLPFDGATEAEIWLAILQKSPDASGGPVPGASAGLLDLIDRCLSKRPARRPASCAEAIDVLDGRAGPPPAEEGRLLVGREEERSQLDRWLDDLAKGEPHFVILKGAAGAGTSALIDVAGEHALRVGIAWIAVTVGPEGFVGPVVRALVRALDATHVARGADAEDARRRLVPGADAATESEQPAEVVRDIGILLRAIAGGRPFVLAIDSIHEADADDLRRVEAVLRSVTEGRGGAILGVRAGSKAAAALAALEGDERARSIEVGPLSSPHLIEVLERQAGMPLDPAVGELLAARSGGNIHAARALLAHLRSVGAVTREGESLVGRDGWREAAILPDERTRVVAALARVGRAARRLVDAAAVDGLEFDPVALAAVVGGNVRSVLREARRLVESEPGLVSGAGTSYRFARAEAREVASGSVGPDERARLHRAFAEHLESRVGSVDSERLARHWEALEDFGHARMHLMRAAVEAARRYERSRFVDLCRRAGISIDGLIDPVTSEVIELALRQITYLDVLRRPMEFEQLGRVVEGWATRVGDDETLCRLTIRRLQIRNSERRLTDDEMTALRTAVNRVRSASDAARGSSVLNRALSRRGDLVGAIRVGREAVELARRAGVPSIEAAAWDRLGSDLEDAGQLDEAVAAIERAITMCDAAGAHVNATISRVKRARLVFDHELARPDLHRFAIEIDRIRALGGVSQAIIARFELARILRTTGDLAGSLAEYRRAASESLVSGRRTDSPEASIGAATALVGLGDVDEALSMVALARAGDDGSRPANLDLALAAAESLLACALGYVSAARASSERALAGIRHGELPLDDPIVLMLEGILIADPDDGAEIFDSSPAVSLAAERSPRLVPRAVLASTRVILGRPLHANDGAWLDAGLASSFAQDHHLVASIATRWAQAVRLAQRGESGAAANCMREASDRARRCGHQPFATRLDQAHPV